MWFEGQHYVTLLAIAALMVLMSIYVFTFPKYGTEQITVAFFGIFYLGIMLSYLYQVRAMADGKYLVWLIFLSSWGCDTCAYCAGNAPWKTPSGTGFKPEKIDRGRRRRCGRIGSVRLHLCVFLRCEDGRGQQSDGGMRGGVCDCGGHFPDRGSAASAIKRNHNVKDYGNLIPGHGGVLDRFDSMIFTAPAIYFALTFLR